MTWKEYETDLDKRLADLHSRVHRGTYRAQPSKRPAFPKQTDNDVPWIAALEDKIVQQAAATVLNQIYEEDFKGFSYGFRPGRSQHAALDALWVGIMRKKVSWVLDADVRDFFGTISHGWMVKFLRHRIADRRILRLIQKWLRAGANPLFRLRELSRHGSNRNAISTDSAFHGVLQSRVALTPTLFGSSEPHDSS
jgi:RNA-directed DNA polymerase